MLTSVIYFAAALVTSTSAALVTSTSAALVNSRSAALVNSTSAALVNSTSAALVNSTSAALVNSTSAACTRSVSCPCGTSKKHYTFCTDGLTLQGNNPCTRWSQCETCQEGVPECITCPTGRSGGFCTTSSCPSLQRPLHGSVDCEYSGHILVCRGRCNTGYTFREEKEVILLCLRGSWYPPRSFPPCKLDSDVCADPGTPRGAKRMNEKATPDPLKRSFRKGESVVFSCRDEGRSVVGTPIITCTENGTWTASLPRCVLSRDNPSEGMPCVHPGDVVNGVVDNSLTDPSTRTRSRFAPGTQLNYSCQEGYILHGEHTIYCMRTGGWSAEAPTCEIQSKSRKRREIYCVPLDSISNGRAVVYQPDSNQPPGLPVEYSPDTDYPVGTKLEFSCEKGFSLMGAKTLACESSGFWSALAPDCVKGTVCPDPGQVRFANRQNEDWSPADTTRAYSINQYVVYTCHQGYQLYGSNVLTCSQSGSWSRNRPTCYRKRPDIITTTTTALGKISEIYCVPQDSISFGRVDVYQSDSNRPPGMPSEFSAGSNYPVGTKLEYSCDDGYVLKGTKYLMCESSGFWSAAAPLCVQEEVPDIDCVHLDPISNGEVVVYNAQGVMKDSPDMLYPVGTQLEYSCHYGYVLEGSKKLLCESSGFWSSGTPVCIQDCGLSMLDITHRISSGNRTAAGEWPWMVSISVTKASNYSYMICGGALLDSRTVLTAAHCFTKYSNHILHFGKFKTGDTKENGVEVRRRFQTIFHPMFDQKTFVNDIAILRLDSDVRFTERILPVCLPTPQSTAVNLVPGNKGVVTGWGLDSTDLRPDELMMARLPVQSERKCKNSYSQHGLRLQIEPGMFCAGYDEGVTSACNGDSGSPFVFYNSTSERYTVEGCVSFSVRGQCGLPGKYTIFTKISYYMPWIQQNWAR